MKLRAVNGWNAERRRHAKAYDAAFKDLPLGLPADSRHAPSIYHLYTVRTARRDALAGEALRKARSKVD